MDSLTLRPIGVIRSPFREAPGTPIQPIYGDEFEGEVVVEESFEAALADLEGFERIWLIYWLHRAGPYQPRVVPYRGTAEHGLFATRSPCRPNPLGLSVVRLVRREGLVLRIAGVDFLDETPLLDLKPYVPAFDAHPGARAGWFDTAAVDCRHADGRFHGNSGDGR
jgi:tRNA-Thr(GGU) m(6)t(6)A37 methyltransferase TsaA